MATTKELIISNSVVQLGHKPIQSLDNADDLVISAEQAYNMLLPSILSSGNWRFATQIAQLSQLNETPPVDFYWTTVYQLPAGYLSNIRVYPQNYDYDIYTNNRLYTNWNGAVWMEYTFLVDPAHLPASFVNYFVYEIAAYLALSNAEKPDYYQALEGKRQLQLGIAMATDAKSRPNFSQVSFPVIDKRQIGGIIRSSG